MGKAFIKLVSAAFALFIGYAAVPSGAETPWYKLALWWGFVVIGGLTILVGLAYVILLARKRLNSVDILDDLPCTYWTREKQLKVTLWFRDYSNSPISEFSCSAKFKERTIDVNDERQVGGTYLSLGNRSYGKSRPIMVEFFKNNIELVNPRKAIVTVSIKPHGMWATRKRIKEVDVQLVNH